MQTCTKCNALSPDEATHCVRCQSDLSEWSTTSVALKRYQTSKNVSLIYIVAADNCCPACREMIGGYPKDQVPKLPVEGCSHAKGCRCFYQPKLTDIFP